MISIVINLFVTLVVLITLILTNKTAEKANGNILLGVSLPHWELHNNEVQKIIQEYHKTSNLAGVIFFLLILPLLIISKYVSISILYILAWCCLLFFVNSLIQRRYFNKLYTLKQQNKWYVGEKHILSIDTEVSRLKGKMPTSPFWFFLAFIISIIPIILLLSKQEYDFSSWIFSICSLLSVVIGFLAYMVVTKERVIIYSENTEINLALNQIYKHQWSKCWILQAHIGSILYTLMFFLVQYNALDLFVMMALLGISTCLTFAPILSAYYTVRDERHNLLLFTSEEVYSDEDQYWATGNYNNPNDKRVWVEKRIGFGTTVNMASDFGKLTNVFLTVIVIGTIALAKFVMPLDFGTVEFEIIDNIAYINAPMYSDSFSMNDIQEVKQVDILPKLSKRNGGDSEIFYVGSFAVQGYGNCSVYVHRNNSPYLVITLSDRIVILNGNTPEKTEIFYSLLAK
ncbi:MAG: PH domain-containing protein [Lachnospiraceae bacterium]